MKINIVVAPQVGDVGAGKNHVPFLKMADVIAYKPGAGALQHHEQLVFGMEVPVGVKKGVIQVMNDEGF
jgi:hypothetical protein